MEDNKNKHGRSMSDNNTGTAGGETEEEREGRKGSYKNIGVPRVNETGFAENEGEHWAENYAQKSSEAKISDNTGFADQEINDSHQQVAKNHVKNVGGTSEEDQNDPDGPHGRG